MTQVPPDLDCLSAIPERIEKITYRVEENVLYLYADANYALMGAVEEILCWDRLSEHLLRRAADHGRGGKSGGDAVGFGLRGQYPRRQFF